MATSGYINTTGSNYIGTFSGNWQLNTAGEWVKLGDTYTWPTIIPNTFQFPYPEPYYSWSQQGWECPKCHRVNSLATAVCGCMSFMNKDECALCRSDSDLTPHGTKHICRRCSLRLIDEALKETEARNAKQVS